MTITEMKSPNFVICGLARGGTSLLSEIFRQMPGCQSGFEVGILLYPTPQDWWKDEQNVWKPLVCNTWQVSMDELAVICEAADFNEFYHRLIEKSKLVLPTDNIFFDKTPAYLNRLVECRAKLDVPFVGIFKDPRAHAYSAWSRRTRGVAAAARDKQRAERFIGMSFAEWLVLEDVERLLYRRYSNVRMLLHNTPPGCKLIQLEEMCLFPEKILTEVFDHVGRQFRTEYMDVSHPQFPNRVRGSQPSIEVAREYANQMDPSDYALVTDRLRAFSQFFYEP